MRMVWGCLMFVYVVCVFDSVVVWWLECWGWVDCVVFCVWWVLVGCDLDCVGVVCCIVGCWMFVIDVGCVVCGLVM